MGCFFWDDYNRGDALQLEITNGICWVALALKGDGAGISSGVSACNVINPVCLYLRFVCVFLFFGTVGGI